MKIGEFKQLFDKDYLAFVSEKTKEIEEISKNTKLLQTVNHLNALAVDGKRIRPYLCFISAKSIKSESSYQSYKNYFLALELIHFFALIHDDIIDEAATRRGVDTIHNLYTKNIDTKSSLHIGESMALLMGDLVFTWAMECVIKEERAESSLIIIKLLKEVISGEFIDVALFNAGNATNEEIQEKNRLKTSSYTFMRPMQLGVVLAGGDEDVQAEFIIAGEMMGEAFQVVDDVKDILGNGVIDYKDLCGDIETNQQTRISNYVRNSEHANEFNDLCGKKLTDMEKDRIKEIVIQSGAINDSLNYAQAEIDKAMSILGSVITNQEIMDLWQGLGQKIMSQVSYES